MVPELEVVLRLMMPLPPEFDIVMVPELVRLPKLSMPMPPEF